VDALIEDAGRSTDHDLVAPFLPELVPHTRVYAYNFLDNILPGIQPTRKSGTGRDVERLRPIGRRTWTCSGATPKFELAQSVLAYPPRPLPRPLRSIVDGTIVDCQLGEGPSSTAPPCAGQSSDGCPPVRERL